MENIHRNKQEKLENENQQNDRSIISAQFFREIMQCILNKASDASVESSQGSWFMTASLYEDIESMEAIDKKAREVSKNNQNCGYLLNERLRKVALHIAYKKNRTAVVEYLCSKEREIKLNIKDWKSFF